MLVEITESTHPILLDLRYATTNNFTNKVVYLAQKCFIHSAALPLLERAIALAAEQGLTLKIFDIFRPQRAQEMLWHVCPNEMYIMNPAKGSIHTRGVAVDLTLVTADGHELDMGTPFDDFTEYSHHGKHSNSEAAKNRYTLLGIMLTAGFDFYKNEWWHYQMFNPREFPLITEDHGMM